MCQEIALARSGALAAAANGKPGAARHIGPSLFMARVHDAAIWPATKRVRQPSLPSAVTLKDRPMNQGDGSRPNRTRQGMPLV